MILDTNALSAFIAKNQQLLKVLGDSPELHLPVIAIGEYAFGLARSRERHALLPMLATVERTSIVLSVDAATAWVYAEVREELRVAGTPIPVNDLWIAALGRQHGLDIASNDAHFDHVRGIRRCRW